ncbi:hypothetical protein [Acinetobacter lwoffii]|nr:hypothetical protein [Acinetobacter lwoffii]
MNHLDHFQQQLDDLKQQGQYRSLSPYSSQPPRFATQWTRDAESGIQ